MDKTVALQIIIIKKKTKICETKERSSVAGESLHLFGKYRSEPLKENLTVRREVLLCSPDLYFIMKRK